MSTCRLVHYVLDDDDRPTTTATAATVLRPVHPCQWVNLDVRTLDPAVFGPFTVLMADPPWFIHQKVRFAREWGREGGGRAGAGREEGGGRAGAGRGKAGAEREQGNRTLV